MSTLWTGVSSPLADGRWGERRLFQTVGEFLSRRDSLVQVVLGQDPGTEDFDVLDGAGFSSAIPGCCTTTCCAMTRGCVGCWIASTIAMGSHA